MDQLLKRLQRSEIFKRYLSPTLQELFNSCVKLEEYYDKFSFISRHGLLPTSDMVWEAITLSDRIRGIVKLLIEKEAQKDNSKISPSAYQTWQDAWARMETRLDELKEKIVTVGIGGKDAVMLKLFSFLADYISFIRANVYPVFQVYADIITTNPETIFDPIESKFALLFVRRFTKIAIKEEEE